MLPDEEVDVRDNRLTRANYDFKPGRSAALPVFTSVFSSHTWRSLMEIPNMLKLFRSLRLSPDGSKASRNDSSGSSNTDGDQDGQNVSGRVRFSVRYLGHVELSSPGLDDICAAVAELYDRSKLIKKTLPCRKITLSKEGLVLHNIGEDSSTADGELFKARRIIYSAVDGMHRRVFSFNYQFGSKADKVNLHVFLCRTRADAKIIAKTLAEYFRKISIEMHKQQKEFVRKHSQTLIKYRPSTSSRSQESSMGSTHLETVPSTTSENT